MRRRRARQRRRPGIDARVRDLRPDPERHDDDAVRGADARPATTTDTGSTETVAGSGLLRRRHPAGPAPVRRAARASRPTTRSTRPWPWWSRATSADPDYRTLVPAGSIETHAGFDGVGDDGLFSVSLTDDQWTERPAGMSKAEAKLAVQQIVYTLQHQAGGDEPTSAARDVLPGERRGLVPRRPERREGRGRARRTRALVNVTAPAEGATVSGSFTASGEASSFEATVPWQIRDESGQDGPQRLLHGGGLDRRALPVGDRRRRQQPRSPAPTPSWP